MCVGVLLERVMWVGAGIVGAETSAFLSSLWHQIGTDKG